MLLQSPLSCIDCLNFLVLKGAVGGARFCEGKGGGGGGKAGIGGGGGGGGIGGVELEAAANAFSASSADFCARSSSDSTNLRRSSRISVWELDSNSSNFSFLNKLKLKKNNLN